MCSLCKDIEKEEQLLNQEHLLLCQKLKNEVIEIRQNNTVIYDDIFSENIEKMNHAVKLFEKAINTREKLIQKK